MEIPVTSLDCKMKVIIGTRTWLGPDWTHVDADSRPVYDPISGRRYPVDIVCDAKKLDLPDQCADYVFSSECIEHFPWAETESVVAEWCRIVAPGGTIRIEAPDFLAACQQVLGTDTLEMDLAIRQIIFGGQANQYDYHYTGITERMLTHWYEKQGLEVSLVQHGWECGWLRVDAVRPK